MSTVALLIGREGSLGFPGKNTYPVLGRPMIAYPLMAAQSSREVQRTYISTDSPDVDGDRAFLWSRGDRSAA